MSMFKKLSNSVSDVVVKVVLSVLSTTKLSIVKVSVNFIIVVQDRSITSNDVCILEFSKLTVVVGSTQVIKKFMWNQMHL